MGRAARMALTVAAALALAAAARGEEAEPAKFSRGQLKGPAGNTVWYRSTANDPHSRNLAVAVLARHGLQNGKDYDLHPHDGLGLLAITGEEKTLELVRSLLDFLDVEQPQIRIKVRIVETSTSRDLQTGLDTSLDQRTSKDTFFRGFSVTNQPPAYLESLASPSIPYTGTSLGFGTVETVDAEGNFVSKTRERVGSVTLALQALGAHQDSNVLAEPDITVLSGSPATIKTLQKYPYQHVQIEGNAAKIYVRDLPLGVTLVVTPFLVGQDSVTLDVNATVENRAGVVEVSAGAKYPFTSRRNLRTSVTVPSGYEIILGGLFQKETSVVEKGVPLLSEIPVLGFLFKSYWQVTKRKELLFFLQPSVVRPRARLLAPLGEDEE